MEILILLGQTVSTLVLTGVIWVTQLTQYPSFDWFRSDDFKVNHDRYRMRIALIATPLMLLELVTGLLLFRFAPTEISGSEVWFGLFLILIVWASMFAFQIPLHERLAKGHDREAIRRLVATNWVRTAAWTCRAVLVSVWVYRSMG